MKKYIHPTLKEEVPIDIRRDVYIKAFKRLDEHRGLCVLLPMILWDLEKALDEPLHYISTGEIWDCNDTTTAFPELTNEDVQCIEKEMLLDDKLKRREEILTRIINSFEK